MGFDFSKFPSFQKKVGTVGTSGNAVENTGLIAFPLPESEWEQVGTPNGEKPDTVPTPDKVGTQWEHREALQTPAVPTVPTAPTQNGNTCTKNDDADPWAQIAQSAEWFTVRFPNEDEALRFTEIVAPLHPASRYGASVQVDFPENRDY